MPGASHHCEKILQVAILLSVGGLNCYSVLTKLLFLPSVV